MAGPFRTDKETQTWAYLEATQKQAFDRVKAGTASKYDYQKVSQILDQYDRLAKSVFDSALESMQGAAQAAVDAIVDDREKKGKAPLAAAAAEKLFDLALKRAFDDFGPDLVETIDTLFSKKLDEQDELTGYRLDDAVEKIQRFLPKRGDPEAKKDRDDLLDEFTDRAEKAFRKSILEVAQEMRQRVAQHPEEAAAGAAFGLPALGGPRKQSIMEKLRDRISSGARAARMKAAGFISNTKSFVGKYALSSPQAEKQVAGNEQRQTSVLESLNNTLKKFIKFSKQSGKSGKERLKRTFAGMLKKYESMKNFFKDRLHGLKMNRKEFGKGMEWAKTIGKAALVGLAYSPLIKYLGSKFAEIFSAENVKETLGKWWEWSKENAPKALAWVWDKVSNFDYKGVAEKVWEWIKDSALGNRKEREEAAKEKHEATKPIVQETGGGAAIFHKTGLRRTKAAQAALTAGGSGGSTAPASAGTPTGGKGDSTSSAVPGIPTAKNGTPLPPELVNSIPKPADPATQKPWTPDQQSKTVVAPSTNYTPTSNNYFTKQYPGMFKTSDSKTSSAPSQSVVFRPPTASSADPETIAPKGGFGFMPHPNKGGKANIMGLGSFGLQAGVDDTLGLTNLGVLQ